MSVAFELRPEARFNDGTPVTAEDVAWTFQTLLDKGRPFYRQYYADIARYRSKVPAASCSTSSPTTIGSCR